ncbi:MAG TPA: hypothetical protein VM925_09745 [Labilithrix sp.]|nr:hypothetical protein [Labilithrix sp.]
MHRSLFRRIGFLTLTTGFLGALACSRSSSSNGGDAGTNVTPSTDGGVTVPAELDGFVQKLVERCQTLTADDPSTEATLREARAAYKRGETDIALTTQGCTRMFVQRSGDKETFVAVASPPFGIKYDPTTYEVKRTAATMSWSTGADGKKEVRGDLDADGFDEIKETVVPDVALVSEIVAPDGAIKKRTTAKVAADKLKVEITEELDADGVLKVSTTYEAARVAHKCTTDPPPDTQPPPSTPPKPASPFPPSPHEIACTPDQLAKLDVLLEKATNGGATCLDAAGMPDIRFRLLRQMASTSFDFKCTDDKTFVAANDGGYGNVFSGRALLWINPILFTAVEGEQTATLYHELMHFFYGHDHAVEALADYSTNLQYADQVYACEQLCFAKNANSCHLAACKKKKICEVDKYAFEQKLGREIQSCWSGHQVGALCRKGPGQRQWCTTKSECDAACGGQECESKSISCDEDCR